MTHYPFLAPDDQRSFLQRVVARCGEAGASPRVVVFDLDGTVLDNRPRTAFILREQGKHWHRRAPRAAEALQGATASHVAYTLVETLARLGVTDPDLVTEAQATWRRCFFTDAYLHHDVPVEGAAAFAQAVYAAGASVVYLTGRDLPNMSVGSWQSLREHGFPIGVLGTELVCKPAFEISDEVYKRDQAPLARRVGEVIASFDNEPGNCNIFLRTYPHAASVLLDTQHAPGAPPLDAGVTTIKNFVF